jgi:putative FmdB family regulatory protein
VADADAGARIEGPRRCCKAKDCPYNFGRDIYKDSDGRGLEKKMPIYEYTCRKCGAHLEVMQKISDKPLSRHARCGGKLEKEWSRTGFQFKGKGWYVTDYAGRKAESKEGKESKPDSSETKAAADSKATESKAKPESKATKSSSTPSSGD